MWIVKLFSSWWDWYSSVFKTRKNYIVRNLKTKKAKIFKTKKLAMTSARGIVRMWVYKRKRSSVQFWKFLWKQAKRSRNLFWQ